MKKLIFCATLVALFTSCMKNDVEVDAVQRTEDFTATFEDGARADLDGTAVVWNDDDHLTIFTKTSHNRQYKVKDLSANGRSATFEYVGYTGSDKTPITNNYAVYPYNAEATILGDVITTTLASEQIYTTECDLIYALMSAKSSTNNFSFVNSGALLRFNISTILPDTFDLNYIKVSSQNHNIAGEVTIDTNDHLAVVTNNGTNEITLAEINETIDSDVKSFYIAMPAMSFEKSDLSVTFSFADGDKTFALPAFDLEQGKIKSIDYSIKDADEFTGSTPGEEEPAAAKPANNEIWYTSDYDLSFDIFWNYPYPYSIISSVWDAETGKGVLTFDRNIEIAPYVWFDAWAEFWLYKTGEIPSIPLTSITLPECVTTIPDDAFNTCQNLLKINIPDSVTTIGMWAFYGCSSLPVIDNIRYADVCLVEAVDRTLTTYTIKDKTRFIGNRAFRECSNLTSITIPDSVTTIGENAFINCSSLPVIDNIRYADVCLVEAVDRTLTTYTIKDKTRFIGSEAFNFCINLTNVTIPDSVTTIGTQAFHCCDSLENVTIGNSVTTIESSAFAYCDNLTSVYCKATTPPELGWDAFDGHASWFMIYVPMESVEAYKSASYWSNYSSYIVGYNF